VEENEIASGMDYQEWNGVDIMKSLCMNCGEEGETRLMLHKIPYFRELIIASFFCESCGERNNEVTFGGEIQLHGCIYELKVTSEKDLDRQLIKSDSASIRISELDFEIPAMTQRGGISTIEGMLKKAAENLNLYQAERMDQMPEVGMKVAQIIGQLTMMSNRFPSAFPFHIIIDDPAGNSFVENPFAPTTDPNLTVKYYSRTPEQDKSLGLEPETGVFKDDKDSNFQALMSKDGGGFGQVKNKDPAAPSADVPSITTADFNNNDMDLDSGVVVIPTPCPHCFNEGESRTALTCIPHFKEVLIMAFNCKECGFRTNEVKGGGGVPTYGSEVLLQVRSAEDLSRDLLKSDTAMVSIPELELELQHGTLGGMFTTVEGLLQKIVQKLLESNPFAVGDSSTNNHSTDHSSRERFGDFIDTLKDCAKGRRFPFTILLRDPLGNSFISAPLGSSLPPEMDKNLKMTDFERTFDENEELGLNDINTDHYGATYEEGEGPNEVIPAGPAYMPGAAAPVVLADRLTNVHKKGPDHPTPFAMGTSDHDNTAGGMYLSPTAAATAAGISASETASSGTEGEEEFSEGPAGWKAVKINVDLHLTEALDTYHKSANGNFYNQKQVVPPELLSDPAASAMQTPLNAKRIFNESDLELEFIAREEWGGARPGYAFRLGAQGLGYYKDNYVRPAVTEVQEIANESS